MGLVTMKYEMMKAIKGNYAVPAFNFFTYETLSGIAEAAAQKKSPVVAMATMSGFKMGLFSPKGIAKIAEGISDDYGINMALHMDHCPDVEFLKQLVDYGFTSVMIDSSKKEFAENVDDTCRVVEYARKYGVTVESELGHVGGKEDDVEAENLFTEPEEAARFVKATDVDALAVAVGTVHGFYKALPKLDFPRISQINELIPNCPLVLHGGTGVPYDDFREAIKRGVRKINVGTELKVNGTFNTFVNAYSDPAQLAAKDPRTISKVVIDAVAAKCCEIIDVMGSVGKADC